MPTKHPKPPEWDQLGIKGCFSWENESDIIRDVIRITNPKNILEIGFFAGASAFMQLYLSKANLISVDPMVNIYDANVEHTGSPENVGKLIDYFKPRFSFLMEDSKYAYNQLKNEKFDLMFIDGDHLEEGVRNDFMLALSLKIPYIYVDDFVTSVEEIFYKEFKSKNIFSIEKVYMRQDTFMDKSIPIYLLKNNLV